jgi:hypothetical protein
MRRLQQMVDHHCERIGFGFLWWRRGFPPWDSIWAWISTIKYATNVRFLRCLVSFRRLLVRYLYVASFVVPFPSFEVVSRARSASNFGSTVQ